MSRWRRALPFLRLLVAVTPALASDADLWGVEGHPRSRFPLAVHAKPTGDASLDAAIGRAVDDWNSVAREALGLAVFTRADRAEDASVLLAVAPATGTRRMGQTAVDADGAGVIALPVRIIVDEPAARGQTSREILLYQVVAHELGHALGLGHARDPRSIMCCVAGSVDFADAAAREAYVDARRHPDLGSVRAQLVEHYARFWKKRG